MSCGFAPTIIGNSQGTAIHFANLSVVTWQKIGLGYTFIDLMMDDAETQQ